MEITITLTEDMMEFLRDCLDPHSEVAAEEFTAQDYAYEVEDILEGLTRR